MMRDLYAKVGRMLDKISFDKIYQGFERFDFALYDDKSVYFSDRVIPYDRRFLGNTSIEYDGEFIAIWKVENPKEEDPEMLAADLVHEMFHAFQRKNKETRYPSDLAMLDYPNNAENFTVKFAENRLLIKAYKTEDLKEKRYLISHFISSRKYRETLIGKSVEQEYFAETIEGMAEYAGCSALKQISEKKYIRRIDGYLNNLNTADERFFDIRRLSYFSGAVFCMVLAQAGMEFCHAVGSAKLPLFSIIAADAAAEKPVIDFDDALLAQELKLYLTKKKQKFEDFLLSHKQTVELDAFICGYDPMNMIKKDNSILCSHFIMLMGENKEEPLFIEGPVMVNLKNGSVNEVKSYIK